MFALGSAALWAGAALGWEAWSFRTFYLFGGILNVPFLALGTVYLLAGPRIGDRVGGGPVPRRRVRGRRRGRGAADRCRSTPTTSPRAASSSGVLPRILAGVGSGAGRDGHHRRGAVERGRGCCGVGRGVAPGRWPTCSSRRGTLVISGKALFEGLGDEELAFAAALASGITIVFVGFLLTNTTAARPAVGHGRRLRPSSPPVRSTATPARRRAGVSAARGAGPCRPAPAGARRRTSPSRGTCSERGGPRPQLDDLVLLDRRARRRPPRRP